MESLLTLARQLRTLWSRLGRGRQMTVGGIGVGAVVFLVILTQMGSGQQTYITAFTNLDPRDSNAVVEELKAASIPYQLSADGGTIKVPPEKLADARLKLAAKGLPTGGAVGFELFDKTSFGVTDFVQNLNYQRALEGELTRTINTLDPVENSRVHIVVPKQELFVAQQKPATASVLLRLRPGRTLDEGALKGISYMVARSVQGLQQQNITIVDTAGRMLFDGGQAADTGLGLSATQLDLQRKIEKGVEGQVQSLLDQVAGPNRAAVRVKADLDVDQQESLSETFTPGGPNNQGVPRSSSNTQATFSGAGQSGSAPRASTNVPGLAAAQASNGASTYGRTETTTNFEVSKTTQKTVRGPGQLKRLNVSVLLDSSITEADAAGPRDAIAAAAGIDQKRGDQLVVTTAAFAEDGSLDLAGAGKPGLIDMVVQYAKLVVPLLGALIVVAVVWRMSRTVAPPRLAMAYAGGPGMLPPGADAGGRQWLSAPEGALLAAAGKPAALLEEPEIDEEQQRRDEIAARMSKPANANPEAVAEIIHNWMTQDDKKKK